MGTGKARRDPCASSARDAGASTADCPPPPPRARHALGQPPTKPPWASDSASARPPEAPPSPHLMARLILNNGGHSTALPLEDSGGRGTDGRRVPTNPGAIGSHLEPSLVSIGQLVDQ